jgi:hypothetical protein
MPKNNEIKEGALKDRHAGQFHAYDGSRPMPEPLDEELKVERHATWASIRERQRSGGTIQKSFTLDEVAMIVKTAVAEALRKASSSDEEAEIKVGGK